MTTTTTIILLSILLIVTLFLLFIAIQTISLWKKAYHLMNELWEIQKKTIENQQAVIESYKTILANGITGAVINSKRTGAN